jgi:hypothetical protein
MLNHRFRCDVENIKFNFNFNRVYQKKKRRIANDYLNINENKHRRERNSTWMNNWYVDIHNLLIYWVRNEHDLMNIKKSMKKKCDASYNDKINMILDDMISFEYKKKKIKFKIIRHIIFKTEL